MYACDEMDWKSWESVSGDQRAVLEKQFKKEIGFGHPLYDVVDRLRAVARDGASDDILLVNPTETIHAFIVHLVWSDGPSLDSDFPAVCTILMSLVPLKHLSID